MANFIIDNAKDEEALEKEEELLKSLRNKKSELRNSCKGFRFINTSNRIGRLKMQLVEVFEEDKWDAIQQSEEWKELQENTLSQWNKVEELKYRISERKEEDLIRFLAIQSNEVYAKGFLRSVKDYVKRKILYYDMYPKPIERFEKLRVLDAIKWCYENWFLEVRPAEVDGSGRSCYYTYILTYFDPIFKGHESISKMYLDMSYSNEEEFHGGLYCEGQNYIHLNKEELLDIKNHIYCIVMERGAD